VFIIIFNEVINAIAIFVINKVGYARQSIVIKRQMGKLLLASFFNTGISFLLANANFEYAPGLLKYVPLRGIYFDFGTAWYTY